MRTTARRQGRRPRPLVRGELPRPVRHRDPRRARRLVPPRRGRLHDDSAIVVLGGQAKERPYPGATTVATVNAGVTGLVHTLATELAPVRVNAVHPGVVGDSPFWSGKPLGALIDRTPTGRLATMRDVADAVDFLLGNRSVNAVNLSVDGGWLLR
ncbi:SDR family oxidoreductase [Streptomyces sp. NPDC001868]|uniref:SDR family oxidoreductase n=1 Tax=Streptomyces sp. NPDC001868 TaxID=3154401 RepID=UPI00332D4388